MSVRSAQASSRTDASQYRARPPASGVEVFLMIERARHALQALCGQRVATRSTIGITAYVANDGTRENAQAIAAHELLRPTKFYEPQTKSP